MYIHARAHAHTYIRSGVDIGFRTYATRDDGEEEIIIIIIIL